MKNENKLKEVCKILGEGWELDVDYKMKWNAYLLTNKRGLLIHVSKKYNDKATQWKLYIDKKNLTNNVSCTFINSIGCSFEKSVELIAKTLKLKLMKYESIAYEKLRELQKEEKEKEKMTRARNKTIEKLSKKIKILKLGTSSLKEDTTFLAVDANLYFSQTSNGFNLKDFTVNYRELLAIVKILTKKNG